MHRPDDRRSVHLPANRAFVVQFAAGVPGGELLSGRAEHLHSGQVTHFASLGDLAAFIQAVLGQLPGCARDEEPA
jgi:hypothetical protein